MIYILNKDKILSYMIASFIVIGLFAFSTGLIPNKDIELLRVSSNVIDDNNMNSINNEKYNLNINDNT